LLQEIRANLAANLSTGGDGPKEEEMLAACEVVLCSMEISVHDGTNKGKIL
jgi:hypothetical protein